VDPVLGGARSYAAVGARIAFLAIVLGTAAPGWGHVFPDHSEPRVGHTVDVAPPLVRIWFDGDLEPVFSTVRVEGPDNTRVDLGDARVDPHDPTLLEVSLPRLPSGPYRVVWSAVARDGHRTEGSFPFRVE
jgi:methionine-rich copper-binding protein CopC